MHSRLAASTACRYLTTAEEDSKDLTAIWQKFEVHPTEATIGRNIGKNIFWSIWIIYCFPWFSLMLLLRWVEDKSSLNIFTSLRR